jgi:membrane protein DedA with SNARE-associated domain
MTNFLNLLDQLFLFIADKFGYAGIFFGAFADVVIPIVPSELVLGLAGSYVQAGKLNFILTLIVSLLGNLSAASLLWFLGKKYGHPFIDKFGKFLNFDHKDLENAERKFNKGGYLFVFFSQFIPLMRSLIPIPSGVLELNYKKFIISIACGATIWNTLLITIGYNLRGNYGDIVNIIKQFGYPLLYICVIVFIFLIIRFYLQKQKNKTLIN